MGFGASAEEAQQHRSGLRSPVELERDGQAERRAPPDDEVLAADDLVELDPRVVFPWAESSAARRATRR
jgi:hypothetical protein